MNQTKNQPMVRIQASGPAFELDFEVPENKAATELRRIKRYLLATIEPIKEKARDEGSYWSRKLRRRVRPRYENFRAEEFGIEKSQITISKAQ